MLLLICDISILFEIIHLQLNAAIFLQTIINCRLRLFRDLSRTSTVGIAF